MPEIYTIEIDDLGRLHEEEQLNQIRLKLETHKNIRVVAFIHGWHHNASVTDSNYLEFQKFLTQLNDEINGNLIGIYVGWRGDSSTDSIDPLTFKDRKRASVAVGEGEGFRKIMSVIKKSVEEDSNKAAIIGHSLGGSVLFHGVKKTILDDDRLSHKLTYVLLNPAVSSKEYSIFDSLQFSDEKRKPLLITIQSNKDKAVNWAFRISEWASPFGFNSDYITHDMWACSPKDDDCLNDLQEELSKHGACAREYNRSTWFIHARPKNGIRAPNCEKAGCRIDWVIDARHTISASHNNILTAAEVTALADILNSKSSNRITEKFSHIGPTPPMRLPTRRLSTVNSP